MPCTLRHARPSDSEALLHLEASCFSTDRFSRRQLRYLLSRANASTLVATDPAQRPLAYATLLFRANSRAASVYSLCVVPHARGGGLGRKLLQTLEDTARVRGCRRLLLEVRADNRIAMRLYRRVGFVAHRWLEDYYADGCAAWRMNKPLDEPFEYAAPLNAVSLSLTADAD